MKQLIVIIFLGFSINLVAQEEQEKKITSEFSLELSSDFRAFLNKGSYENQEQFFGSLAIQPEFNISWDKGEQTINGHLFGRLNSGDQKRSHWDVRELYYQIAKKNWELSVGLKKVYWGVAESAHLVDVINQTDLVESFDGEEKLGQPMLQYVYVSKIGTFETFILPYHRYRTLPGERGRLRFPIVLNADKAEYESDLEKFDLGGAFRYSHYFSVFDVGLSYIYHSNREFLVRPNANSKFVPYYEKMQQFGLDVQATTGSMLWKFEGINRIADSGNFQALVAGGEYTFGNIKQSGIDLGVLAEFLYDNRKPTVFDLSKGEIEGSTGTGFQKDIFAGMRLAFNDTNDTAILFGGLVDLEKGGKIFSIEAERRFFQNWKANLELRILTDFQEDELFYFFQDDSFAQFTLSRFF